MANLTLRLVKGVPLTNAEVDGNFSNLNISKVEIGRDLSGNIYYPVVSGIQGRDVSSTAPSNAQVLKWSTSGNAWAPATISYDTLNNPPVANIILTGDVTGSANAVLTANTTIITISATTVQANSVALGTDTTGDYVANVLAGTGIEVTNQGGETASPTVALTNTGVVADTYGNATVIPIITFDAQGRATSASNVTLAPYITASSTANLTNKLFDVSVGSNNQFSIQGQSITSYSGYGQVVILQNSPTISVLNVSDSQLSIDGGSGSFYWSGQSGVAQAGDLKAGVYSSDPSSNNSLFTFGVNGANVMSVAVEGSMFIGTSMPSNNGGLNTSYPGWLVVQSGGKFGGDIDTLGALKFNNGTTGYIQFYDTSIQNTAYNPNVLTTANVIELNNLYYTNSRVRSAITTGNTIGYDSATGNITLTPSGVTANTYGGSSKVPVLTIDQYGRVTAAANVNVAGVTNFVATGNSFTISTADGGSFTANIQQDSVRLGTDTTGNYVSTVTVGSGLTVSGTSDEGNVATVAHADTSSVVNVTSDNSNGVVVQDVTLEFDTFGHVTTATVGTVDLDARYLRLSSPNTQIITSYLDFQGNVTFSGNVTTIGANNLVITDNFIYINDGTQNTNVDVGLVANYNDGTYAHTGIFRDASDSGTWKVFEGYLPEPDENVNIDTDNASFRLASFAAKDIKLTGNLVQMPGLSDVVGNTITLSTTTETTLHEFSATTYNSGKFTITGKQGSNVQISEFLVAHDGAVASGTEYGVVKTSGVTVFAANVDISGGNMRVNVIGTSSASTKYVLAGTQIYA